MSLQLPVEFSDPGGEAAEASGVEGRSFQTAVLLESKHGLCTGASVRITQGRLVVVATDRPPVDARVTVSFPLPDSVETVRTSGRVEQWREDIRAGGDGGRQGLVVDLRE